MAGFDWTSHEGVSDAVQPLMLGMLGTSQSEHVIENVLHVAQGISVGHEVLQSEIVTLLSEVDFSYSPSVIDMCACSYLPHILSDHGFAVVSNSVCMRDDTDYHYDAMQSVSYERLRAEYGCHVIMIIPAYDLIDAILPLAVQHAKHFVCCRVPCRYINERGACTGRDQWIKQLEKERRLLIINPALSVARAELADESVWLVIDAAKALKEQLEFQD